MTTSIVRIPKDILRMREADVIVKCWCEIQVEKDPVNRIRRYAALRSELTRFRNDYFQNL